MIDLSLLRHHPQQLQKGCLDKNIACDLDALRQQDQRLKELQQSIEKLRGQRNQLSKEIPQTKDQEKRGQLTGEVRALKENLETLNHEHQELKKTFDSALLRLPLPARQDVPVGKSDANNVELRQWGDLNTSSPGNTAALSHIKLGEKLGLFDFSRAVRLSGSRSYVLTARGALLERAVLQLAYDILLSYQYTPMRVPVLVSHECMEGTGYFPIGKDQAYICEKDQLALVGTSEVSLCSFYRGERLKEPRLPLKLFAQSTCFRREAGSYGKDTKGLYRVHQFEKIEQVIIAPPDKELSGALHDELLDNAETILQQLELPYRVVMVCTGDLGQGQYYKHDLEAWMPSRENWGETHSCSSFLDFQARRLNIRFVPSEGSPKPSSPFCYTLNNTAIASPRILIPLLEVHQTPQGDVRLPAALRPYLRHKEFLSELPG